MGFWVCGGAAEADASMKALPKRKGNLSADLIAVGLRASMKALPKRKGNDEGDNAPDDERFSLNESPSQKEGKFGLFRNQFIRRNKASMKALPKRKGNWVSLASSVTPSGSPQ